MTEKAAGNIGLLMRCYEALRNWQALLLLAGGVVIGLALMVGAGEVAVKMGFIVGLLFALIALLVYLAGINGAGLLLVDQADGRPGRGILAAFFGGLHATLTSFLATLLLFVSLILVFAALYLLSLLGKIPGVGSFFAFLLAGPSAIVLAFCYGVLAIGTPLLLVAVWRGEGVLGSLGRAVDIVLKRPLDALLHFVLLWLIVMPVALFVFMLMVVTSGVSLSIYSLGFSDSSAYYGSPMDRLLAGAMSSFQQLGAASASIGIAIAVLLALFVLVGMFGYIMVYDSLNAGVASSAEGRLRGGFDQLKQKVEQHRPQAVAQKCKSCGGVLIPGDQFCGECGQRI